MDKYDLIVIGAGPGGYVAAIRAAQLGMNVCCVDKEELGGTCLNVGCIPSKALLDSSEQFYRMKHSMGPHGITMKNLEIDIAAMMKRKAKIVKTLTGGIGILFRKKKITHEKGYGKILSPEKVEVKNGDDRKEIAADKILIATGSKPVELPFMKFDGERIVSSTEAIAFESVPQKLVVIGAGAVGLELGSVWSRLGSEVTVVEMMDTITPGMDREMSQALQKSLEKQGLKFKMETGAKAAEIKKNNVKLTLESHKKAETLECDKVLVAVGRRPMTDGLGVDALNIQTDKRGFIQIDENYQTNVEGIYAIGDVVPGPMLAHKAEDEGVAVVEKMAGLAGHVNYDVIPGVVYTHPELASVGMTEEQLKEKGIEYKSGSFPFLANGRAKAMEETEGKVKILADARTDKVLGMHILGAHASDLIAEGALAMEFSASAEDIARSTHAHPTLPEIIKEAALAVNGSAIHM